MKLGKLMKLMKLDITNLTIKKARSHLVNGDFSARELAEAYLKNIEKKNPSFNIYLEVFDDIVSQAKEADKRIAKRDSGPLIGIPLAVKDNILIEGKRVTAASKVLEGYTASYDATVIRKLKAQGSVFLGRTNQDEFAMGSSTENSAFGTTRNPHDTSRVPGGSSGGSAAAVAADCALAALGSDTGGSIRQPASFCGVVGLKPTYGSVSRYGLIALGSSLDVIGPLAKTVSDAEVLFHAIKGHDEMDSTAVPDDFYTYDGKKKRMTIGVPYEFVQGEGVDEEVRENFEVSLGKLRERGFEIRDIELPHAKHSLAVYYIIMPAEASTNLARFDGVRYGFYEGGSDLLEDYRVSRGRGFGKEVRRRIILGTHVLSSGYYDAYYNKAAGVRELVRAELKELFDSGITAIATPTTPTPAFTIGEKSNDPLAMYLADIFTTIANIAGVPAISVPSGFAFRAGKNLPLGMQFLANHGDEDALFAIGSAFEEVVSL